MPAFDNPLNLMNEARTLYHEGKWSAAAFAWARSKEAARTFGEQTTAFEAGVWEALAWSEHGDQFRALSLLLSLLADIPPDAPPFEKWLAHAYLFVIQNEIRPELARLRKILTQLESLAAQQTHPLGDLHLFCGWTASARGEWAEALKHLARGWHAFDGSGLVKLHFAWEAIVCCLSLKRRREAERWQKHLSVTEQDKYELARRSLKAATVLLALDSGDHAAVAECVDNGCGWDQHELRGQLFLRGASLAGRCKTG